MKLSEALQKGYARYEGSSIRLIKAIGDLIVDIPIGGSLYCYNNQLEDFPKYDKLQNGQQGKNWVYLDGSLTVFKSKRKYKGYTIYTNVFNKPKYAVTNGVYSAHASSFKQAVLDIRFKEVDRNVDLYKGLTLDSELGFDDAIIMYRVITGACSGGVEQFITQNNIKHRKYTVQEILKLTKGSYGHEKIKEFFIEKE